MLPSLAIIKSPANRTAINWTEYLANEELADLAKKDSHPDLLIIQPIDGKYNLENIRQIDKWASQKPFSANYKLAVIENAELLTIECQNKLLKLIEEAPTASQLILITSNFYKLLPTVRSRLISFRSGTSDNTLNKESIALIKEFLLEKSLIARQNLTEKICESAEASRIVESIISELIELKAVKGIPLPISQNQLLEMLSVLNQNNPNLRLTLETIAIMLR